MNIAQHISQFAMQPLVAVAAITMATVVAAPTVSHKTVNAGSAQISVVNGFVYAENHAFNGHLIDRFGNGSVKRNATYRDGQLHGVTRGWHENGALEYARFYRNGREEGTHAGWYENRNRRFEYHYRNGVSEGVQKQWYPDGKPYTLFHFENGQEAGQQQMWDSDGKPRANYIIRDGRRYGLPGSVGCRGAS